MLWMSPLRPGSCEDLSKVRVSLARAGAPDRPLIPHLGAVPLMAMKLSKVTGVMAASIC